VSESRGEPPISTLLVDDDASFRAVLTKHLEQAGHVVTQAGGARQAITLLQRLTFDVVIADMLMPNGDGLELLIQLSARPHSPAVLAMSGGGDYLSAADLLHLAVKLRAQTSLVKPFTAEQFFAPSRKP
jgi:DNA-binding NtrC family response regulator